MTSIIVYESTSNWCRYIIYVSGVAVPSCYTYLEPGDDAGLLVLSDNPPGVLKHRRQRKKEEDIYQDRQTVFFL